LLPTYLAHWWPARQALFVHQHVQVESRFPEADPAATLGVEGREVLRGRGASLLHFIVEIDLGLELFVHPATKCRKIIINEEVFSLDVHIYALIC